MPLCILYTQVKVDRYLVGHPQKSDLLSLKPSDLLALSSTTSSSTSNNTTSNLTISNKDKRLLKMLTEELVDPDKMLLTKKQQNKLNYSNNNNKDSGSQKLVGMKTASNTVCYYICVYMHI